jgi:hypothetical protein
MKIEDFVVEQRGNIYKIGDEETHLEFSKPVKLIFNIDKPDGALVKVQVKHE